MAEGGLRRQDSLNQERNTGFKAKFICTLLIVNHVVNTLIIPFFTGQEIRICATFDLLPPGKPINSTTT
jgi:hypothetical protein